MTQQFYFREFCQQIQSWENQVTNANHGGIITNPTTSKASRTTPSAWQSAHWSDELWRRQRNVTSLYEAGRSPYTHRAQAPGSPGVQRRTPDHFPLGENEGRRRSRCEEETKHPHGASLECLTRPPPASKLGRWGGGGPNPVNLVCLSCFEPVHTIEHLFEKLN